MYLLNSLTFAQDTAMDAIGISASMKIASRQERQTCKHTMGQVINTYEENREGIEHNGNSYFRYKVSVDNSFKGVTSSETYIDQKR